MQETKSVLNRTWIKLPLIIRAVLTGFAVSTIGVISWSLIATFVPMPWSFIIMAGLLWVFWKYFSGSWRPNSTQQFRVMNFRRTSLSKKAWLLSLLAALLIVLVEQSGLVVTFRIIEFPAERFSQEYNFLENVPIWAAWLVVIMISAVAGICEEIGFRGYMQVPLEMRYGPFLAISLVSVVFVLVHLHQAWSEPILIQIFFISVLFGTIAYYSRSLIPGIVAHFTMDICNFSFWWTKLGWQFNRLTVGETGVDFHFVFWLAVFVLSLMSFVFTISKLAMLPHQDNTSKTPANLRA